jgi:hypothetical protein
VADVFPDRSMEQRDKIAWMVETNGWAIVPMAAQPPRPGYAYTVGLEGAYGFPEVVIFGLTPVAAKGLAGLLVEFLADGVQLPIGPLFQGVLDNGLRSALLPVDIEEHLDLFEVATMWHGTTSYRVVQLAWPDRNGWMPWESGFDHRLLLAQPVVGSLDGIE